MCAVALLVSCVSVWSCGDSARDVPALSPLLHRCVRLRQPMKLVATTARDGIAPLFLSTADFENKSAVRGVLAAGTELTIVRVVQKRSLEITYIEVVSRVREKPGVNIGSSMLFTPEWQSEALKVSEGHARTTRRMTETSLDSAVAEWCSERR